MARKPKPRKPKPRVPKYGLFKPRNIGRAAFRDPDRPGHYVRIYFPGQYNSAERIGAYHKAVAHWNLTGRQR